MGLNLACGTGAIGFMMFSVDSTGCKNTLSGILICRAFFASLSMVRRFSMSFFLLEFLDKPDSDRFKPPL